MDVILEKEIGVLYTRDQLKELLRMTGKDVAIDNHEIDIVTGALEFSLKTVEEVMTKLDDVFMVDVCPSRFLSAYVSVKLPTHFMGCRLTS